MFMLITYITCFAIYLATQQRIHFYFRGNISSFMTENNSSRFFWTPGTYVFGHVSYVDSDSFITPLHDFYILPF